MNYSVTLAITLPDGTTKRGDVFCENCLDEHIAMMRARTLLHGGELPEGSSVTIEEVQEVP